MGCLPTRTALARKGVILITACPCCGASEESDKHILCECPSFASIWPLLGGGTWVGDDLVNIFRVTLDSNPKAKVEQIAMTWWSIWRSRNDYIWRGEPIQINKIMTLADKRHREWRMAHPLNPRPHHVRTPTRWEPPPQGWFKINVDGAINTITDNAVVGLVLRNEKGQYIKARSMMIEGIAAPILAEAWGLYYASKWAVDAGFRRVEIESDCLQLVNELQ